MSNLYVGRKCIAASWNPLKMEPGGQRKARSESPSLQHSNLLLHIKSFLRDLASYLWAYLRLIPLTAGRAPTEGPYCHQRHDSWWSPRQLGPYSDGSWNLQTRRPGRISWWRRLQLQRVWNVRYFWSNGELCSNSVSVGRNVSIILG